MDEEPWARKSLMPPPTALGLDDSSEDESPPSKNEPPRLAARTPPPPYRAGSQPTGSHAQPTTYATLGRGARPFLAETPSQPSPRQPWPAEQAPEQDMPPRASLAATVRPWLHGTATAAGRALWCCLRLLAYPSGLVLVLAGAAAWHTGVLRYLVVRDAAPCYTPYEMAVGTASPVRPATGAPPPPHGYDDASACPPLWRATAQQMDFVCDLLDEDAAPGVRALVDAYRGLVGTHASLAANLTAHMAARSTALSQTLAGLETRFARPAYLDCDARCLATEARDAGATARCLARAVAVWRHRAGVLVRARRGEPERALADAADELLGLHRAAWAALDTLRRQVSDAWAAAAVTATMKSNDEQGVAGAPSRRRLWTHQDAQRYLAGLDAACPEESPWSLRSTAAALAVLGRRPRLGLGVSAECRTRFSTWEVVAFLLGEIERSATSLRLADGGGRPSKEETDKTGDASRPGSRLDARLRRIVAEQQQQQAWTLDPVLFARRVRALQRLVGEVQAAVLRCLDPGGAMEAVMDD